jgi:hypothetical protein
MSAVPHRTSLPGLRGVVVAALACTSAVANATGTAAGATSPGPPSTPPAPLAPPGTSARPALPSCPTSEQSALTELSCELARGLGALGDGVTVAVAPPVSDRAVSRSPELGARIARALARELGGGARVLAGEPTLDAARAAAFTAKVLVYVVPEIQGGEARLVADAHPVTRGFWDRLRTQEPAPVAHAFAARRLDAELASFLPPVPLVAGRVERVLAPSSDVVALACADVDRDGALELVVVGRRKIQLARVRRGALAPFAEASWASLSPVAPSPLREPLAGVSVVPGLGVDVGLTDRALGFRLSERLDSPRALDAPIPWARAGCLVRSGAALGRPGPCTPGGATMESLDVDDVDAIAGTASVDREGHARSIVAFRGAGDRAVTLRDDAGHTARLASAGAALALGDLDLDGEPDLVTSVDTLDPAQDAIVVRSWSGDGTIRDRLRVAVPEGVRALAVCPVETAGQATIVAATTTGLSVLR